MVPEERVRITVIPDLDTPVVRQSLTRNLGIRGWLEVAVVEHAIVLLGSPEVFPVAVMLVFNV